MVLVLLSITLVSATALGYIYGLTKGPIEDAKRAKTTGALAQVLPEFDNDPSQEMATVELEGFPVVVYTAKKGGQPVGYAVETATGKGFSGLVKMMVGFTADGTVHNIEVLEHNETPGLGSKMADPDNVLVLSFRGKKPSEMDIRVKKDGGDVDVITASTISSRAYADAVERALRAFRSVAFGEEAVSAAPVDPYKAVLTAEYDNDPTAEGSTTEMKLPKGEKMVVHTATSGDPAVTTGFAIESRVRGFGELDDMVLLVGFDTRDVITGIHVLGHSETQGFGAVITEAENPLAKSIVGRKAGEIRLTLKDKGGDVDAISGSTITSEAYAEAVRNAVACYFNITGRSEK